jgi:squalene cyclase
MSMHRTAKLLPLLLTASLLVTAGEAPAPPPNDKTDKASDDRGTGAVANLTVTQPQAEAVRLACDALARMQQKDGSFSSAGQGYGGQHRAAMTGLAGMALLSAGHVPGRGKHADVVKKAVTFLLKLQDREGCYADDGGRSMHGHGYALHFMAEAYGMTNEPELARQLRKSVAEGVKLTARSQSPEGGWIYQPVAQGHEGSITITQVQAIWAARQAGINVPQKTIDKGIDYMRKSQQPDGGICYRLGMPGSRPALSVAGVMVFCGYGMRESREATKAIDYMRKMLQGDNKSIRTMTGFDHYATLYLGQALYQAGDPDWSKYYPGLRDEIVKTQGRDGTWQSSYGPAFGTACYTLVLTVPYQYLPTFQR